MSNNFLYCSKCKSHHHPVECPFDDKVIEKIGKIIEESDLCCPSLQADQDAKEELAAEIYNNRKSLGLYTLSDMEIDSEKIIHVLLNALAKLQSEHYQQAILARTSARMSGKNYQVVDFLAKVIAKEKPIKIK